MTTSGKEMKPKKEKKQATIDRDAGLAVAFEDMLAHREVLRILKQYENGYLVQMDRSFRPNMGWVRQNGPYYHTDVPEKDAAPVYRVHIRKYKGPADLKQLGDAYDECFEWRADGSGRTYVAALREADRDAQNILRRRAERLAEAQ